MDSNTFWIIESNNIGLLFKILAKSNDVLGIGCTILVFQLSGKIPLDRDKLKIKSKREERMYLN